MKKFIYFLAIAGVALAGCTKNEVTTVNPDRQITFNTVVGVPTKADIGGGTTYPTDQNFQVWAVYTGDTDYAIGTAYTDETAAIFMNGVEQAYVSDQNGWAASGTTKYYWPKAGKLSFWAVSPTGTGATVDMRAATKQITKNGYTITDAAPDSSNDFMFSDIEANKTSKMYTAGNRGHDEAAQGTGADTGFDNYEGVNILFHHALSRIEFKAKKGTAVNSDETFTVTQVKVTGAKSVGNVTIAPTAFLNGSTSGIEASNVNWSNQATPLDLNPLTSGTVVVPANDAEAAALGTARLVIPQTSTGIVFHIWIKSKIGDIETNPVEYTYTLAAADHGGVWEWGKRYIYTLIINEDQIYFDPMVVAWTDADTNLTGFIY